MSSSDKNLVDVINSLGTEPSDEQFKEFLILFAEKLLKGGSEEELIKGFQKIDKDGNGLLSIHTLREHFLGILTEEETDQLIRDSDIDGDGYINYFEYVEILQKK